MATSTSSGVLSGGVLATLLRHKWKAILIPTLSLLIAAGVILFFPRTYHSEAVFVLQVGHESVSVGPTATTGQTIALQQTGRDDEVKSAIDILRSRGVLAKAVERLGADVVLGNSGEGAGKSNPVADFLGSTLGAVVGAIKNIDPISAEEEALISLSKSLSVDSNRGSTAIEIDIEAETPKLAQTILTALLEVYQEEHARVHRNQSSQAFFQGQHDKLQQKLEDAKLEIRKAKDEMKIATITGRRSALEQHSQAIEMATYQAEQQLAEATAQVTHIRKELSTMPSRIATSQTTLPNQGTDLLRQELYTLEIRQAALTAKYNDTHPLVVAVASQVSKAQEVIDAQEEHRQETVDDVNLVHQTLSLNLKQQQSLEAGLKSRLEKLGTQSKTVLQDLLQINDYALRLDRLEREARLRSSDFFKYAANLEQARIDQELEEQRVSNVYISQEPLLIEKPVSPSKLLVLLASLFMATAGTGAAILASDQLNDSKKQQNKNLVSVREYTPTKRATPRDPTLVPK